MRLLNKVFRRKRASPLVEEAILLGVALFIFLLLGAVIFDLVDFAKGIFSSFSDTVTDFPE